MAGTTTGGGRQHLKIRSELVATRAADFAVSVSEHVRWGDMDAFGHMNNAVFFKLFESARMAYFERTGFIQYMTEHGIGPILAHTDCHFRKPLTYPCALVVTARTSRLEVDRLAMDYAIFAGDENTTPAACGTGIMVCYDYRNRCKAPLPASVVERIRALDPNANATALN